MKGSKRRGCLGRTGRHNVAPYSKRKGVMNQFNAKGHRRKRGNAKMARKG